MVKLICVSDDNVHWIDVNGEVFGIVNAFDVLDCDGLIVCGGDVESASFCDIFEDLGVDVLQDYENEANILEVAGGMCTLVVTAIGVELVDK